MGFNIFIAPKYADADGEVLADLLLKWLNTKEGIRLCLTYGFSFTSNHMQQLLVTRMKLNIDLDEDWDFLQLIDTRITSRANKILRKTERKYRVPLLTMDTRRRNNLCPRPLNWTSKPENMLTTPNPVTTGQNTSAPTTSSTSMTPSRTRCATLINKSERRMAGIGM